MAKPVPKLEDLRPKAAPVGRPFGEVLADVVEEIRHLGALSRQDPASEAESSRLQELKGSARLRLSAAGNELIVALRAALAADPRSERQ